MGQFQIRLKTSGPPTCDRSTDVTICTQDQGKDTGERLEDGSTTRLTGPMFGGRMVE